MAVSPRTARPRAAASLTSRSRVRRGWLKVAAAGNYPATSCHPVMAHWLRIYPPGETAAGYLGHTFDACSSASAPLLTVLPVRSGQRLADSVP